MKKVSVIIPTYKNRGGLLKSIDSVLSQDFNGSIEVIVVDDNNPETEDREKTSALMQIYSNNPKVIYICHDRNKNGAAARNTGIKKSTGDYIALLDDDDFFLQGKIQKQVSYLNSHPEYSAVYCGAQRGGYPYGTDRSVGDCTKRLLMLQSCIYTPCQMFKREALLAINGYDETFYRHQDYDLLLRFFHAGFKIGYVPEILTEIGTNQGENILSGYRLEEMKKSFFEKFMPYIEAINQEDHCFKNRVLSKHYAGVFLNHIKHRHAGLALRAFVLYFWRSPLTFIAVVTKSVQTHLKKKI